MFEEPNDPEFQIWAEAARRSAESTLTAALGAAETEKARRAVISGFTCALATAFWQNKPADWGVSETLYAWTHLAGMFLMQIAAGLTPGRSP